MPDNPAILIQNVSEQCIPNLIAAYTFRPSRIVWIYTPEFGEILNRLREQTVSVAPEQQNWRVDARDVQTLHARLKKMFEELPEGSKVIYHLTGGTKSMALLGLFNLGSFRRNRGGDVQAVVMNPVSQHFDTVYPNPANKYVPCASLTLENILAVHGNVIHYPGRSLKEVRAMRPYLDKLRILSAAVKSSLHGREVKAKDDSGWFVLTGPGGLPDAVKKALLIAAEAEVLNGLEFNGARFRCKMRGTGDPIAYVRNLWIEDWVAAVLGEGLSDWNGGYAGIKVRIRSSLQSGNDFQEFDFLGARKNRLVYWSCKNVKEVKAPQLFEVDALRDEVGGRDFHIAGLIYIGKAAPGIRKKAQRLNVHLVDALEPDAEKKIVRISG